MKTENRQVSMQTIRDLFQKIFQKKQLSEPSNVEALRVEFKDRYHSFKLLLNANNKALEVMADIELSLSGTSPFGMSLVRASCTSVSVSVFNMLKNMDRLAPDKYKELYAVYNNIQQKIERKLTRKKYIKDARLLVPLSLVDKHLTDLVGSKMANLGEIKRNIDLNVPEGFVITTSAYQHFIEHNDLEAEINRRFQSADAENIEGLYNLSAEIQQMIIRSEVPRDLMDAVTDAWTQLEKAVAKKITLVLRSSALGEDVAGSSFAGQYRSVLNVSFENVFEAYKEILASKYSLQAISYRLNKGFRDEDVPMCVGCLVMVEAAAGGVTYTRNPVNIHDDSIFINSAWGLPKSVVDGGDACDLFVISRIKPMTLVKEEIQVKEQKFVCYPEEGVCRMDLTGETKALPSIDHIQALTMAKLAVEIEEFYGFPQDIEWAVDINGTIYVLQCRPLQQKNEAQQMHTPVTPKSYDNVILAKGGITASPGSASGKVNVVERGSDMLGFPHGAVLVTRQALPRWASLLPRAAAVVTETGGFAGHLANVAREFGVPALFGVNDAQEKLKPHELITVDASNRRIYKGPVEDLLTVTPPQKNLMQGSPVYEILKEVSRYIVPLHLLDPYAKDFSPKNCQTFHDITRFVHEKSVHEMFNFGKEHNFSERSSKQLYYNVPMQWWILNLDDGFKDEVKGKYVKLENIVSVPMLAFWKGFVAIPWDGPPALDGKGFLSVMFQSTTNRALEPGMRSPYAERNYFMISKNFCSLNSRLGYHFSILETLLSERSIENYISFQFKGGAADIQRRFGRVRLIGEILEQQDFRVEINEDNLTARIENQDMEYMKKCLEILGYLTLHTRQIDMIMSKSARIDNYRKKIKKDIQSLLSQP
jgi:pyruvate,water dikinase